MVDILLGQLLGEVVIVEVVVLEDGVLEEEVLEHQLFVRVEIVLVRVFFRDVVLLIGEQSLPGLVAIVTFLVRLRFRHCLHHSFGLSLAHFPTFTHGRCALAHV